MSLMEPAEISPIMPPCDIAANIKLRFGIETVAHLTCINSTKDDVKVMIERLADADIRNVKGFARGYCSGR